MFVDVESPDAEFYDLVSNPERFTGYAGQSAVNIWKLIYDQNCFKYLFVCLSVCLSVSVRPSLCLSVHLTSCLSNKTTATSAEGHNKTRPMHHCMVLPPGQVDDMMLEPLAV